MRPLSIIEIRKLERVLGGLKKELKEKLEKNEDCIQLASDIKKLEEMIKEE